MFDDKSMKEWARANGSGSLRQAIDWGMAWFEMALHERLAMEVASSAELVPLSRLKTGPMKADPDCRVTTELGWYARTLQARWLDSKSKCVHPFVIKVVYFTITHSEETEEGAGFVVTGLDLPWFPPNRSLLIPLAYYNTTKKEWERQENPL